MLSYTEARFITAAFAVIAPNYVDIIIAICAVGALAVSIWNTFKIDKVYVTINSRMDQLLATHGKSEHAEGVKEGKEESTRK